MSIADKLDALSCLYTAAVVEQLLEAATHSPGVIAVARERLRQISAEGYDAAHDDGHPGEMAVAGAHYGFSAGHAITNAYEEHERAHVPAGWPWGGAAWKPKTPERDIERGAALLVAEYDALHRRNILYPRCDGDGVPPHEPGTSPCPACEGTGKDRS